MHGRTHGRFFLNVRVRFMRHSLAMFEVVDIDSINRVQCYCGSEREGLEDARLDA